MVTQRIVYFALVIYLCVVVKEPAKPSQHALLKPAELLRRNLIQKVVGVTGVEPVTLRLSSACSNQLSYTPNKVGGAEETRTPDL
jgi:hypothetical protein